MIAVYLSSARRAAKKTPSPLAVRAVPLLAATGSEGRRRRATRIARSCGRTLASSDLPTLDVSAGMPARLSVWRPGLESLCGLGSSSEDRLEARTRRHCSESLPMYAGGGASARRRCATRAVSVAARLAAHWHWQPLRRRFSARCTVAAVPAFKAYRRHT